MDDIKLANIYASAIYDIAIEKNSVTLVANMLDMFVKQLKTNDQFRNFLDYPEIKPEEKKKLINSLQKLNENMPLEILDYLIDKKRLSKIEEIRDEYITIDDKKNGRIRVKAIFSKEISENQKQKLIEKISKLKNKKVILEVSVDKTLISGGLIQIGDEIIDGSLINQIRKLQKRF